MATNIHQTALDEGGFLTPAAIDAMAEPDSGWRLHQCLVRCSMGRFTAPAQDVKHYVDMVGKSKDDYVRDVGLLAGMNAGVKLSLRRFLGELK